MYGSLEGFSLRQVKFVRTRTSVLKATTHLIQDKEFDEITVDEICHKSQISRGTFFNYFLQKNHIFYYYIRIFTIKIVQRMEHWDEEMPFREKLEHIYRWFDEESQYPQFIKSYIYYLIEDGSHNNTMKLTEAEFVYFFSGIESNYEYYNNLTIEGIIQELCIQAKEKGEISLTIDEGKLAKVFLIFLVGPFMTDKLVGAQSDPKEIFDLMLDGFL